VVFLEKERNIQLHSSSRRKEKQKANFTKRASASSTDFDFYNSLRKSRQEVAL